MNGLPDRAFPIGENRPIHSASAYPSRSWIILLINALASANSYSEWIVGHSENGAETALPVGHSREVAIWEVSDRAPLGERSTRQRYGWTRQSLVRSAEIWVLPKGRPSSITPNRPTKSPSPSTPSHFTSHAFSSPASILGPPWQLRNKSKPTAPTPKNPPAPAPPRASESPPRTPAAISPPPPWSCAENPSAASTISPAPSSPNSNPATPSSSLSSRP